MVRIHPPPFFSGVPPDACDFHDAPDESLLYATFLNMTSHGMGATKRRMKATVNAARKNLSVLQTGRAHPELIASIKVPAWGGVSPLEQVAQIGILPPRSFIVSAHDPSLIEAIEKALNEQNLGSSARRDGTRLLLDLPQPSSEQRTQRMREAQAVAEEARIAIRLARRDAINELRKERKAAHISEAKLKGRTKDIQALCDEHISLIETILTNTLATISS